MTLQSCWEQLAAFGFETDKGSAHSYISVYEALLAPYRDRPIRLLELGVLQGASLSLWARYFARAEVIGVDFRLPVVTPRGATVVIGDATVEQTFDGLGDFDIIIDDASHRVDEVGMSFHLLRGRVRPGGLYVIEDATLPVLNRMMMVAPFVEYDRRAIKGRFDARLLVWGN